MEVMLAAALGLGIGIGLTVGVIAVSRVKQYVEREVDDDDRPDDGPNHRADPPA